jgi:transposase
VASEKPDVIEKLLIDKSTLPFGKYESVGFESRQVFDIDVSFTVTEYQAEILRDKNGLEYIADFPIGVTEKTQYGNAVKATSVYLSQHQLIPQARVCDVFKSQFGLTLSSGSVNNFNYLAAEKLAELGFTDWLNAKLISSEVLHADETGINVSGKRHWIHCLCNGEYTYFFAHKKRGTEAMDLMGVLPYFKGLLVHDHWKPYFTYICKHILCNAHHRRELERAFEQDGQAWALKMKDFLDKLNATVNECSDGVLSDKLILKFKKQYRKILILATKECPENVKQRAQSKSRNLLERLLEFEQETLRFIENENAPFTNNQGERDLRMTKVQQKISGCFRAMKAAENFCLIKSFLSTCRKHGLSPMEALKILFGDKLPEFMTA